MDEKEDGETADDAEDEEHEGFGPLLDSRSMASVAASADEMVKLSLALLSLFSVSFRDARRRRHPPGDAEPPARDTTDGLRRATSRSSGPTCAQPGSQGTHTPGGGKVFVWLGDIYTAVLYLRGKTMVWCAADAHTSSDTRSPSNKTAPSSSKAWEVVAQVRCESGLRWLVSYFRFLGWIYLYFLCRVQ